MNIISGALDNDLVVNNNRLSFHIDSEAIDLDFIAPSFTNLADSVVIQTHSVPGLLASYEDASSLDDVCLQTQYNVCFENGEVVTDVAPVVDSSAHQVAVSILHLFDSPSLLVSNGFCRTLPEPGYVCIIHKKLPGWFWRIFKN